MNQLEVVTHADSEQLLGDVLRAFLALAKQAIDDRGVCRVALSGGSTPRRLYEALAHSDLDWSRLRLFWGDERNVPQDDAQSNYRMVAETLLRPAGVPPQSVFPVPVDVAQPAAAAHRYEATLRQQFGQSPTGPGDGAPGDASLPHWDLVLLGLGDDVHTASLFPQTRALQVRDRWFVENWVEKFSTYRYTLTAPAINSGRQIWFLVSGQSKREALGKLLDRSVEDPHRYPAQLIRPTGVFATADAFPN